MEFARPAALWLLALLVPLAAWLGTCRRRRAARWRALGQDTRPEPSRSAGWLLAFACLVTALAQPRWGRTDGPPLPPGHDVVLLVDVSRSMGARDAVPGRLGLAAETAATLVRALGREPGSRAGVVVFAGRAREACPLTGNLGAVADVLGSLRPGEVRPGGTDLGTALAAAAEVFDQSAHAGGRTVVLFSDGEDHARSWEEPVSRLKEAGVIVHTVAVGDAERGETVPAGAGPLRYRGQTVVSRRDDAALEAIARITGGAFVRLGLAHADLGELYLRKIAPTARREREALSPPERAERYAWFVLAAVCLVARSAWPGRRPFAARRWLAFGSLLCMAGAGGHDAERDRALARGAKAFGAGQFQEALREFERASSLDHASGVAAYDAAATLFRLERYADAYARYQVARERADAGLKAKIDFALGNTALALGDVAGAVRHYEACLSSPATEADTESVRRDAAANRQYAEALPRPPRPRPEPEDQPPSDSRPRNPRGKGQMDDPAGEPPAGDKAEAPAGGSPPGGRIGKSGGARPVPGKTAREQLDAVLDQIRAETARRRVDDQSQPAPDVDRKDW